MGATDDLFPRGVDLTRAQAEPESSATESFHVPALDCPEELVLIERKLKDRPGLLGIRPDYLRRTLHVDFEPQRLEPEAIARAIRELGFEAEYRQRNERAGSAWQQPGRWLPLVVAGMLLAVAAGLRLTTGETTLLVMVCTVTSTVVSGYRVAWAGWRAVRLRALDMNSLMTLAATGALLTGDYFEAATAMLLFGVALMLEGFSLDRARRAVQSLIELSPSVAHRLVDGNTEEVAATEVVRGDRLLVRPGERLPADGQIESGRSVVNQAPITGESMPVEKAPGDEVFAGSLNGHGSLVVRVSRGAEASVLAQIRRLVEQAQASRSPTERFVDRFARRYTPSVIALAVVLALFPPLLGEWGWWPADWGSHEWLPWLHRGLVLLVIACPCALVISTPITIVCGLYQAARRGVLIKGGEHLENAASIDHVVLDKTGTLTRGRPQLVQIDSFGACSDDEVLRIAASLEHHSSHPLAVGIITAARERGLELIDPEDFVAHEGLGIAGRLDEATYYVGSAHFVESRTGVQIAKPRSAADGEGASAACVFVAANNKLVGILHLADQPRPDAQQALQELRKLGDFRLTMLTGDSWSVARPLAEQLGIDDVQAEMLPEHKLDAIERLVRRHAMLAMVGDGVNDAPALAAARLGVAFGSGASATALETADVVVLSSSLRRLPELFALGRHCRTLLRQNIAFALTVKAVVLVLAALGMATMWMAVAADVGASLVVIFNGMRLIGYGGARSCCQGTECEEPIYSSPRG